jgi:hypothetical protein
MSGSKDLASKREYDTKVPPSSDHKDQGFPPELHRRPDLCKRDAVALQRCLQEGKRQPQLPPSLVGERAETGSFTQATSTPSSHNNLHRRRQSQPAHHRRTLLHTKNIHISSRLMRAANAPPPPWTTASQQSASTGGAGRKEEQQLATSGSRIPALHATLVSHHTMRQAIRTNTSSGLSWNHCFQYSFFFANALLSIISVVKETIQLIGTCILSHLSLTSSPRWACISWSHAPCLQASRMTHRFEHYIYIQFPVTMIHQATNETQAKTSRSTFIHRSSWRPWPEEMT